ncbi:peptidase M18 aminopeptidase I [Microthyrium microscopicum]|uniref:Peptidase M18 aminopeptidase I n=1 Tax=Microthyrium microscopicum TaxID=703497 RepID=A0A6A6UML0_9PEZI|nr:peptidase M18 aminopeptidase I [Microthyrium microscopicum]
MTRSRNQMPPPNPAPTSSQPIPFLPNQSGPTLFHQYSQAGPEPSIEKKFAKFDPSRYTKPFLNFLQENPTVFHAVRGIGKELDDNGFKRLSEQDPWELESGGKYYLERNGSSLISFVVGKDYVPGGGAAIIAGHIDAVTVRVKPIPKLRTKAGYEQLGVAPYAGGLSSTWWDRDLSIGGRVIVKENGKITSKLVKLPWPIAKVPTLAVHFGAPSQGPFNPETQMVPIIGLDQKSTSEKEGEFQGAKLGGAGSFAATQPPRLVKAIAGELNISDYKSIVNWELELFDCQPAQTGGLDHEFIFGGRLDDKLCSWAAIQALINSTKSSSVVANSTTTAADKSIKIAALFDDEEIGSLLRQGARGNFLPGTITRINVSLKSTSSANTNLEAANALTFANSFLVSADVTHAVNPNFLDQYLENHAPELNVGITVEADPNGHTTSDAISTAYLQSVAEKCGATLQVFQIRNDSRSGGTVGPMLSAALGCRAVDAGIPQLSMHSIRATTGSLDPGLGVQLFQGFYESFEDVNAEFKE